jgi:glutamate dehydrogenase/leucine dehydrogenase
MIELFDALDSERPDAGWQRMVAIQDRSVGLRAIVVLHSLARGPAFGGIRRVAYASEQAGFADARRLAHAMTLKCALADLPAGGGKTVIFDGPELRREAAYEVLGRAIERLGGDYVCGPDVGTGDADLEVLRRATRWVNPAGNDASRSTAAGVLAGLRGLSRVVFGDEEIGRRRYVIQGLGAVGSAVAVALRKAGAEVSGWDVDADARERARAAGVEVIDESRLFSEPCDVFMPCALGGVLRREVCERASWRAVCGAANNQLADDAVAQLLHHRQIAWAPDFVVNAGAVIEGVEAVLAPGPDLRERVERRITAIADRCAELLERARVEQRSPLAVALEVGREAVAGVDKPGARARA